MGVSEERERSAGSRALLLLAAPRRVRLLTDLADGAHSLADLRREPGAPPQTTMRGYLRSLAATGVVTKRRQAGFPGLVDYRLTAAGDDLLGVAEMLAAWLATSPHGPIAVGTARAKHAIKALIEGRHSGMVQVLAFRPCSLTELDEAIFSLSYPALERRLASMHRLGLVEVAPANGRSTRFVIGEWLRTAAALLDAAAQWERRWLDAPRGEEIPRFTPAPTQ